MSTCGGSLRNSPPIIMGGVLMFRSARMHRTGARSTASGTSSHMQSWADCITGTHESSFWKRHGPQRRTRHRADDAAELTRESRHTFLFKTNHKRATASEGVEYKSSYPSYPDAVHRHFPQSKIREKNFSPHAVMSSERVGRNQLSVGASSPSE